jgi:hypothetical protein
MSEYEIPAWCDVERVPVATVKDSFYQTPDGFLLVEKLNKLFKEHIESKEWVAEIKWAKEFRCKMCNNICEVMHDDITKERTCNICGKGKLEYAIKVMAESENRNV